MPNRSHNMILSLIFFSFLLLVCAGCGENKELSSFKEKTNSFCNNVAAISSRIESIDETSDDAIQSLTSCLEEMTQELHSFAEADVPKEFASVEDLADDASEYMAESTRLYKEAYETTSVNEAFLQAAYENYNSAMRRIGYIATLLQGKIPEGATITNDDGTEFEPYTDTE